MTMRAFVVLSLGAAGSVLAWPGHSRYAPLARAVQSREVVATPAGAKAPVAATWFASWHATDYPLSNVSWSKYSIVTYSFALTTPDVNVVNITDPDVFKDFVSTAHANNCSAAVSVGGWTGSQFFSTAVATAENRTAFVKTMTSLVTDNNLDGLDFDWEYPGLAGIGCNTQSPNDTSNFLAFLTELRTALPNTTFSAATALTPFVSSDAVTPSTDVSGFASVLDYIAIMNYDVWGPWSTSGVGPNAPLNDTCANSAQQLGSAVTAVDAWTKAGMPTDQIVLAVAAYGHGYSVSSADALSSDNTLDAYPAFNTSVVPPGDAWNAPPAPGDVDACGNPEAQSGNWDFWGLISGGFLTENGTANTARGAAYRYDECSQTPYVYNKTTNIMVSYDDATSFAAKGSFIKSLGLRGFAMWEAGGDYNDILLDSIRSASGFTTPNAGGGASEGGTSTSPDTSTPTASATGSAATTSEAASTALLTETKTLTAVGGAVSASPTSSTSAPTPTSTDDGGDCEDDDEAY